VSLRDRELARQDVVGDPERRYGKTREASREQGTEPR
jgi:hypothetical protein